MLEGNELEKKFDGGKFIGDVDDKGNVKIVLEAEKSFEDGALKAKSSNSVETNIFTLAEKICAKNSVTWDEAAIAGLKKILGIGA